MEKRTTSLSAIARTLDVIGAAMNCTDICESYFPMLFQCGVNLEPARLRLRHRQELAVQR